MRTDSGTQSQRRRRSQTTRTSACTAAFALLVAACRAPQQSASRADGPLVEFTHSNSIEQHWPFGLDEVTTKIIAEPLKPENSVESYWLVRLKHSGALEAELCVRPEFPGTAFEPIRGVDYELELGTDRNGATIEEYGARAIFPRSGDARTESPSTPAAAGKNCSGTVFLVRVPALERDGQAGFAVRAKFLGDSDGPEPPKSLLVEILRVTDVASGRELPLGPRHVARWLIVDSESGR